jgi:GAF domain-containing protein
MSLHIRSNTRDSTADVGGPGYDIDRDVDPRLREATRKFLAPLASPRRLAALASYDLTAPDLRRRLDEISERTAKRLNMPTSMVSIVLDSAQFFAGSHGLNGWMAQSRGTPLEWAFCAHGVQSASPTYVVTDATAHPAHLASPMVNVEGTRSYAGAQIMEPGGQVLGMHCVVSTAPRSFTEEELAELRSAAAEIAALLEEHRRETGPDADGGGAGSGPPGGPYGGRIR